MEQGKTEASWLPSTNTFKQPLKTTPGWCKWGTTIPGGPAPLFYYYLASIISLFGPHGSPFCSCFNLVTLCLPLLLIPALLVSLVKIISWTASRQRRSSRSAVPSDTFSSAKVNLLTGKVPVQTLQTGPIKGNLAVLQWAEQNCNAFSELAPEEKMQILSYYLIKIRLLLSFVTQSASKIGKRFTGL